MKKVLFVIGLSISSFALAQTEYVIQHAMQDKVFIINGKKFKAQSIFGGWERGDILLFRGIDPFLTDCFSVTAYNRNKGGTCELYCKYKESIKM